MNAGTDITRLIIAVVTKNGEQQFNLNGRLAWALRHLLSAGRNGCTLFDTPAPRWSGYIHRLRHDYSLEIETVRERHIGPYPGTHARYVLRSLVRVIDREAA